MKRLAAISPLLVLGLVALVVAPVSAATPPTDGVTPAVDPFPFTTSSPEHAAASGCIVEFCRIFYPEMDCTCEWVWCNGNLYCGILHETSLAETPLSGTSVASCGGGTPESKAVPPQASAMW